jgi:segregation and condensation protein A
VSELAIPVRDCSTSRPEAWEDLPRSVSDSAAPVLRVEGFEGPLDWLVELARTRKIDLARLSIVALIEAFATAMTAALARQDGGPVASLARWGDWLVMAATLAWLRSRLLLAGNAGDAEAALDAAEALRRELVDRAAIRAAADWLEQRPQLGRDVFTRGRLERAPASDAGDGRGGDITELARACLVALRLPVGHLAAWRSAPIALWRASDARARIERLFGTLPDGSPLVAFLPEINGNDVQGNLRCRAAIASTLVAALELAKGDDGTLTLDQERPWAPIHVSRRNGAQSDDRTAAEQAA